MNRKEHSMIRRLKYVITCSPKDVLEDLIGVASIFVILIVGLSLSSLV